MTASPFTADDIAMWRDHPITAWYLGALKAQAMTYQDQWASTLKDASLSDRELANGRLELACRADECNAAAAADYAALCGARGEDVNDG
jgi:hypothetical protein